jgi:hypothetical protein
MTALSLERIVHPRPRRSAAPRLRTVLSARTTMIEQSIRAAQELDAVVSPGAQLRVMERFAARIDH